MLAFIRNAGYRIKTKLRYLRHRYVDNFLFIHINKTGGSSIEQALNLSREHKTALEKIDELGHSRWNNRFTFTIVRNPWDKVVSHYHYRLDTNQRGIREKNIPFKKWVRKAYGHRDPEFYDRPRFFMPQVDWISNHDGEIIVDYIGRFEKLYKEFNHICSKLDISVDLPHLKASQRDHYRRYYDEETKNIVAESFKNDIEQFGYRY